MGGSAGQHKQAKLIAAYRMIEIQFQFMIVKGPVFHHKALESYCVPGSFIQQSQLSVPSGSLACFLEATAPNDLTADVVRSESR